MKPRELIDIRHSVGLTQTQFAKALNVTFCTESRWENGHCKIHRKYEMAIRAMQCRKRRQSPFKPMQIVIAKPVPKKWRYSWKTGESLLYLGEIKQMPGHVAVVDRKGKVHWGYHDDTFREPKETEV
jgi:transcriptional regulator with XRE-family HTH domain